MKHLLSRTMITVSLLGVILIMPFSMARADGHMFTKVASAVEPSTPLQEAVIIHDGSKEHLILKVDFEGEGSEFAWVVPLPSLPEVELFGRGLFAYLERLSAPKAVPSLPGGLFTAVGVPLAILYFYFLIYRYGETKSRVEKVLAIFLFVAPPLLLVMIVPFTMMKFLAKGEGPTTTAEGVTVHEVKTLGNYETATISAQAPEALAKWLRENGYRLPEDAGPVIKHYVDKGWCFVAVKLKADKGKELITIKDGYDRGQTPPLAFTFASKDMVFPLKITALGKKKSLVMIYALGPEFVRAEKFKIMVADQIGPLPEKYSSPPARSFGLSGSIHLTRLWASLQPAQMADLVLKPDRGIKEKRGTVYTEQAKLNTKITLLLCLLPLVVVLLSKGHLVRKIVFAIMIMVTVALGSYPLSLFSRAPIIYNDTLRSSFLESHDVQLNLRAIYEAQINYFGEHNTYGQTFEQIGWRPEKLTHFTYFLSRDEFIPRDSPDADLYDSYVDIDPPTNRGFTALAIGNNDEDYSPQVWSINDQNDRKAFNSD